MYGELWPRKENVSVRTDISSPCSQHPYCTPPSIYDTSAALSLQTPALSAKRDKLQRDDLLSSVGLRNVLQIRTDE